MHFTTSQKQAMLFIAAVFLLIALFEVAGRWLYPPAEYDFSVFEQQFRDRRDSINTLFANIPGEAAPLSPGPPSREQPGNASFHIPPAEAAKSPHTVANELSQSLPAGKININTATIDELTTLPRVGPKIAARIIAYRLENGRFATIEELMRVRGIGQKTFAKLKERITVE